MWYIYIVGLAVVDLAGAAPHSPTLLPRLHTMHAKPAGAVAGTRRRALAAAAIRNSSCGSTAGCRGRPGRQRRQQQQRRHASRVWSWRCAQLWARSGAAITGRGTTAEAGFQKRAHRGKVVHWNTSPLWIARGSAAVLAKAAPCMQQMREPDPSI
jgi:hypothetical protein